MVLGFPLRLSPPLLSVQEPGAGDLAPAPVVDTEAGLASLGYSQHSGSTQDPSQDSEALQGSAGAAGKETPAPCGDCGGTELGEYKP